MRLQAGITQRLDRSLADILNERLRGKSARAPLLGLYRGLNHTFPNAVHVVQRALTSSAEPQRYCISTRVYPPVALVVVVI